MSRMPLTFGCNSLKLAGTLDTAPGSTGLLIVTGGNEVRSGAFCGQSLLARDIAAAGFPVFRFDRRGVGDSEGENRGFQNSGEDINAAIQAFRALAPNVTKVIGFGNCDAASALMLASGADCDGLVLSNPWTFEDTTDSTDQTHSAHSLRSRYLAKLRNPKEVWRLLTGGVDLRKLSSGLKQAAHSPSGLTGLAAEMHEGLAQFEGPSQIIVAENDRTGQAFIECWPDASSVAMCANASHAYVEPEAGQWLRAQLLQALRN